MNSDRFEQDRALAMGRLLEAERQSAEIAARVQRWRSIGTAAKEAIGEHEKAEDPERHKWLTDSESVLFAWSTGAAKLPQAKELDRSKQETKLLHLIAGGAILKLLELDAASYLSQSEVLENRSRLRHIDALEMHYDAREAIESIASRIGSIARVNVEDGDAELAQMEADQLLEESSRQRRMAEEAIAELQKKRKKGNQ